MNRAKITPTSDSLLVAKFLISQKLDLENDSALIDEIIGVTAGNKYALLLRSVLQLLGGGTQKKVRKPRATFKAFHETLNALEVGAQVDVEKKDWEGGRIENHVYPHGKRTGKKFSVTSFPSFYRVTRIA